MQHATITKVYISDKSKDGKKFISKNGKPYWKVAIKTDKTGDDYYSSLVFREDDPTLQLKEGDEKLLSFTEENGYKNFKLPSKTDILEAKIDELERRVRKLENPQSSKIGNTDIEYPQDINPDEIPF